MIPTLTLPINLNALSIELIRDSQMGSRALRIKVVQKSLFFMLTQ